MGKKILSILGLGIVLIGIVFGGNLVLILVGAILLGLGQTSKENGNNSKNKQVFHEFFDDVNIDPVSHLLDVSDTNIPLPKHDYCSGSGYVQGKYKGLDIELCTIKLIDVTEVFVMRLVCGRRMRIKFMIVNGCCAIWIASLVLG